MTVDETLRRLVQEGALVSDQMAGGVLTLPIHAEIVHPGNGALPFLYWCEADAEDQHHTHARAFDHVQIIRGRALDVRANGRCILYIASIATWPALDTDELHRQLAAARRRLDDPETRALFDTSVIACRPRAVSVWC